MRRNGFLYVLIWTLVILLFAGLSFGVYTLLNQDEDPDDDPIIDPKDPVITASFEGYTVYKLDDVSFTFVIARITFASDSAMDFGIDQLVTSEQLSLAQTQVYQDELLSKGLFLSYQMVEFELPKNKQTFTVNVFIPVKNADAEKITLTTKFKSTISLDIDLTFAQGVKEMLGYVENDPSIITDNESYKIKVLEIEDLTNTSIMQKLSDGEVEQATFSSRTQIIGVKMLVEPLGGEAVILNDSRLKLTDGTVIATALDSSYFIDGFINTIGHQFLTTEESYLIFDVYSDTQRLIEITLTLEILFSDKEEWISVLINE